MKDQAKATFSGVGRAAIMGVGFVALLAAVFGAYVGAEHAVTGLDALRPS